MKLISFIMFIFVSCSQAILNLDFCVNFTSGNRGLNPSNCTVQKQHVYEKFNVSIKDSITKNVGEYRLSYDLRKASGGRGASGGGNVNYRPTQLKNSAESLLSGKLYWISSLTLYANLALI